MLNFFYPSHLFATYQAPKIGISFAIRFQFKIRFTSGLQLRLSFLN